MKNRKIKIICVCVLLLVIVLACFWGVKGSQAKMIESVHNLAETAGLKNVSVELSEYDKGKLFVECSNFERMEWETLFAMYENMMNVRGVNEIIFSQYTYNYGYILYEIDEDENMIQCYGGDEDIDYYGSWENSKKHYTVSSSAIKEDLEERKNGSGDSSSDKNTNNSSSNSSDSETDAKVCAVKAVKDSLKSPSTAEFCKYTEMTATNLGGNKWEITGWVDAQNSFGATIRDNWTVTLTLTSSGFKDATVTID